MRSNLKIRINSILPKTNVEGPGTRFCIWVQGCSIHCVGCANSALWDKNGGKEYSVSEIVGMINRNRQEIEGVTFLGGEPLEQIKPVTEIAKHVQQMGLSVLVFTGYDYDNLKSNPDFCELEKYVDILIDGKYEKDKRDFSRPWVGSSNQNYYFLSDRYDESILSKYRSKFEIHLNNGEVALNGMGDIKKLKKVLKL